MIIDSSHRVWIGCTATLLVAATALYIWYARAAPEGPSGGSWQGLAFGTAGTALMIYAGLLAARKKVPRLPIGTAQTWLKGHIWLSLLSVPLILFHSGFRLGGLLEQALMISFALVTASGMVGLGLQHYLPQIMKTSIPAEAIFEQLPQACVSLQRRADQIVSSVCGPLLEPHADGVASHWTGKTFEPRRELKDFYVHTVRPFLAYNWSEPPRRPATAGQSRMLNASQATATFAQLQDALPEEYHEALEQLRTACDERRQLAVQRRLHYWLHGWLIVHVPFSLILLILGIWHIVMSAVVY